MLFCGEPSRSHPRLQSLKEPEHLPMPLLLGQSSGCPSTGAEAPCSAPQAPSMAGEPSLPLPGAPEAAAPGRAPLRVAGGELLLPPVAFCLQPQAFCHRRLRLPQGFCGRPVFVIEPAHQLPLERGGRLTP